MGTEREGYESKEGSRRSEGKVGEPKGKVREVSGKVGKMKERSRK